MLNINFIIKNCISLKKIKYCYIKCFLTAELNNQECLLIGDFNVDVNKTNRHTEVFKNFLKQINYCTYDTIFKQIKLLPTKVQLVKHGLTTSVPK